MEMTRCLETFPLTSESKTACLVSGGLDSMVLLDLASRYRERFPFGLTVVHFNYHLRGGESERDEAFVRQAARRFNLPIRVMDEPVAKGPGLQERVRALRLKRMGQLAAELGFTYALMAHHADDQAETVLMRILRGAGLRGLCGMDATVDLPGGLKILRPLLDFRRGEIAQYAREHSVGFVEDASNATDAYFRNRLRHQVLPGLEREIPDFVSLIRKTSAASRKEYGQYLKEAQAAYRAFKTQPEGILIKNYLELNPQVRFLIMERFLKEHGFNKEVSSSLFGEIEALLQKKKPLERLYGSAVLAVAYGFFHWRVQREAEPFDESFRLELGGPGRYWIEPLGQGLVLEYGPKKSTLNSGGQKLFLNAQSFKFPLSIRFVRPGDRFVPFGMNHSRKLQDYFTDRKVPRHLRRKSLLLEDGSQVLCIVGHQISEYCRVRANDPGCLEVFID